jgi:UDP-glucose 4-epimerase
LSFSVSQNKIDCVVHFAAKKAVGESVRIPLEYYKNNITGTCTLLEVMADNDVFNLLFSSSSTVYGVAKVHPTHESEPTGACTNPYGRTKYMCEEIMKDVCSSDEVKDLIATAFADT